MQVPVQTEFSTTSIPDNDDENPQHYDFGDDHDDDDFPVEDGDDDDDFGLDEMNYGQAPSPRHNLYPGAPMCIICYQRPALSKGGRSHPTCGLNCARILESSQTQPSSDRGSQSRGGRSGRGGHQARASYNAAPHNNANGYYAQNNVARGYYDPNINHPAFHPASGWAGGGPLGYYQGPPGPPPFLQQYYFPPPQQLRPRPVPARKCVICRVKPCNNRKYVTCGLTCAEKLCKGGADSTKCNYCHRRPKVAGYEQCGKTCGNRAKAACLLCKSRPKFKRYHLCGKSCKLLATKSTPLILEVPPGHVTFDLVEKKFKSSWMNSTPPAIKGIFKIIENKSFLAPYDKYKRQIGNEVFNYHGTKRRCTLGAPGNTQLCSQPTCALCSILRTSFKVSLARAGSFGAGVYSSSASSMAYGYAGGTGAVILCKVVLGNIYNVNAGHVTSCPSGFNSVVYNQNGASNETIVYSDDAIRPVFLLVF